MALLMPIEGPHHPCWHPVQTTLLHPLPPSSHPIIIIISSLWSYHTLHLYVVPHSPSPDAGTWQSLLLKNAVRVLYFWVSVWPNSVSGWSQLLNWYLRRWPHHVVSILCSLLSHLWFPWLSPLDLFSPVLFVCRPHPAQAPSSLPLSCSAPIVNNLCRFFLRDKPRLSCLLPLGMSSWLSTCHLNTE